MKIKKVISSYNLHLNIFKLFPSENFFYVELFHTTCFNVFTHIYKHAYVNI